MEFTTPIQYVPRVGPVMAEKLAILGIHTIEDLLYYPPFRYNDFSHLTLVSQVRPETVVTVKVVVKSFKNVFTKTGKKLQEAVVADASGELTIIWFNQIYLVKLIMPGTKLHLSGKINWFGHKLVMESPEYEIISGEEESLHTGRLVPVYNETAGISSKWLRGRVHFLLNETSSLFGEQLPQEICSKFHLMPIGVAIREVHFPTDLSRAEDARRRLSFDELLPIHLTALRQKSEWIENHRAPVFQDAEELVKQLMPHIPFTLTEDQNQAIKEIFSDLGQNIPMNRLLIGDVGSGKTVVAASAMWCSVKSGYCAALMAPTQILAEQHFATISKLLSPLKLKVVLATSQTKEVDADADIYIGTHALLSQRVEMKNLGVIVIDEQHRFGVKQRQLFREKTGNKLTPHILTMSATPIPRTIAQTVYGNLNLSTLTNMPTGRKRIKTWLVPNAKRPAAYEWIKKELTRAKSQAFVVCPLIDTSETLKSVRAASIEVKNLKQTFTKFNLGLLHGRMKPSDKTQILDDFREHKVDILVTTPVVEVGIDIPNATVMVIEAAERFGLSQLHQLRGRVGRSDKASYCLLFTESEQESSRIRLKSLETIFNGPQLAELDLKLRGPGDLLGTRQHGLPVLKIARFSDQNTLKESRQGAEMLISLDPELKQFPALREKVDKSIIQASVD